MKADTIAVWEHMPKFVWFYAVSLFALPLGAQQTWVLESYVGYVLAHGDAASAATEDLRAARIALDVLRFPSNLSVAAHTETGYGFGPGNFDQGSVDSASTLSLALPLSPQLNLAVDYGLAYSAEDSWQGSGPSLGIDFKPLASDTDLERAAADFRKQSLMSGARTSEVVRDARRAYMQVVLTGFDLAIAGKKLEIDSGALKVKELRKNEGLLKEADVADARISVFEDRSGLAQVRFDYRNAILELSRLSGRDFGAELFSAPPGGPEVKGTMDDAIAKAVLENSKLALLRFELEDAEKEMSRTVLKDQSLAISLRVSTPEPSARAALSLDLRFSPSMVLNAESKTIAAGQAARALRAEETALKKSLQEKKSAFELKKLQLEILSEQKSALEKDLQNAENDFRSGTILRTDLDAARLHAEIAALQLSKGYAGLWAAWFELVALFSDQGV